MFIEGNLTDNYSKINNNLRIKILEKHLILMIIRPRIARVTMWTTIILIRNNSTGTKYKSPLHLSNRDKHCRIKLTVQLQKLRDKLRFLHLCNNNLQI